MTNEVTNIVVEVMPHFEGYVYPNEATHQPLWSVLIVLYPYITGPGGGRVHHGVAGARVQRARRWSRFIGCRC